jgi:hypothetical protein
MGCIGDREIHKVGTHKVCSLFVIILSELEGLLVGQFAELFAGLFA